MKIPSKLTSVLNNIPFQVNIIIIDVYTRYAGSESLQTVFALAIIQLTASYFIVSSKKCGFISMSILTLESHFSKLNAIIKIAIIFDLSIIITEKVTIDYDKIIKLMQNILIIIAITKFSFSIGKKFFFLYSTGMCGIFYEANMQFFYAWLKFEWCF